MSTRPRYASEGGKFELAEALFTTYCNHIRCPRCPSEPGRSGYIRDSAGKKTKEGENRRQWTCRMSKTSCRRLACTEYINEARIQLGHLDDDPRFSDVVKKTIASQPNIGTSLQELYLSPSTLPRTSVVAPTRRLPWIKSEPDVLSPPPSDLESSPAFAPPSSPLLRSSIKRRADPDPQCQPSKIELHKRAASHRQKTASPRHTALLEAIEAVNTCYGQVRRAFEACQRQLIIVKNIQTIANPFAIFEDDPIPKAEGEPKDQSPDPTISLLATPAQPPTPALTIVQPTPTSMVDADPLFSATKENSLAKSLADEFLNSKTRPQAVDIRNKARKGGVVLEFNAHLNRVKRPRGERKPLSDLSMQP